MLGIGEPTCVRARSAGNSTRSLDGGGSVPIDVAAMRDAGYQRRIVNDREDDAVLADPELAEACKLPCPFGTGRSSTWQFRCQLGEDPIRFRFIEATQIARHRPLELNPMDQGRLSCHPARQPDHLSR